MKKSLLLFVIPLVLLGLILGVGLPWYQNYQEIKKYAFTMDSSEGKVSLKDFNGRYAVIYFGYMFCPDVCPTSLTMLAEALKQLPQEEAKRFQPIFISVDPERDTLKGLKEYANYFYAGSIGLTSNPEYLKQVSREYNAYYAKEYLKDSKMDYSVSHTSNIYIMDKEGKLFSSIRHATSPAQVLAELKRALKEAE